MYLAKKMDKCCWEVCRGVSLWLLCFRVAFSKQLLYLIYCGNFFNRFFTCFFNLMDRMQNFKYVQLDISVT